MVTPRKNSVSVYRTNSTKIKIYTPNKIVSNEVFIELKLPNKAEILDSYKLFDIVFLLHKEIKNQTEMQRYRYKFTWHCV